MDGLVVIDKPEGMTSLDVVRTLKEKWSIQKAGHIGTLDPFATGVLPIVIGEGTKLVPFLQQEPKEYEAIMKLGEETTTDDPTGEISRRGQWEDLSFEKIHSAFQSFSGKILQTPPMFSAIKMKGKPLYRMARKGLEIDREPREVYLYDLQIQRIDLPRIHFFVSCSKGTYVRALARDLGRQIGCGAHLLSLRRIRSGPYMIHQAHSIERIKVLSKEEAQHSILIPIRKVLNNLPEMIGDEHLIRKVRHGMGMKVGEIDPQVLPPFEKGQWLRMSSPDEELVAILRSELKGNEMFQADPKKVAFRPVRVFHLSAPSSKEKVASP